MGVITRAIHDYVGRDWAAIRASKDRYWAERIARLGPLEGWRIADALREQARRQSSGWPSPESRDDDVQFHVRVAALLRRAGATRRR